MKCVFGFEFFLINSVRRVKKLSLGNAVLQERPTDKFRWDLNVIRFFKFRSDTITITLWKESFIDPVTATLREHNFVLEISVGGSAFDDGDNSGRASSTKTLKTNSREDS